MKKLKSVRAVSLVSLVITIIVLLILSGIVISLIIKDGLINKTQTSAELTNRSVATEKMNLKITNIQIQCYADTQNLPSLQYLSDRLCEDNEIEYVELSSKIASLEPITIENDTTSIFTKLKEYPYEFEINGSLQLASIDGIKVSETNNCDHISNLINDFSPIVKEVNGTYISLELPEDVSESSVGYAYLLNNKVVALESDAHYCFMDLDLNTNYEISVMAIDVNGKIKFSSALNQTTLDKLYLYNAGTECTPITGGWLRTGYHVNNSGTFTSNEDNMYIYSPNGSRIFGGIKNAIDLSEYSKLFIESTGNQFICQITTTSYFSNNSGGEDISYTSGQPVNISNYNGNYYIHLTAANAGNCTISKVWLEK